MCGICGVVTYDGSSVEPDLLERMCAALRHRGPDGQGVRVGPSFGLAQSRLAIIDLDPSATAPLSNEDGTIWVTFNGEIYNYRELRSWLLSRGHLFRTVGDTEVLVHLYEELGDDLVHRLHGMFAFAIWDGRRRRLLAARDRLGKKPFVYVAMPGRMAFASEFTALFANPSLPREPHYQALDLYLNRQYVPSPHSAFVGIRKLPPGHVLTVEASGEFAVRCYWEPRRVSKTSSSREEAKEEMVSALRDAVRARLIADVPLGAFLSGGVDSGAVVALMVEESARPVRTFSIGFEDHEFNELPLARRMADQLGTEHHELVLRPDKAAILSTLVQHFGEPFADSSALPTYFLSQWTRQYVTVALSGDGGDENFAGYESYGAVQRWNRWDRIPTPARRAFTAPARTALQAVPSAGNLARASRALSMMADDLPRRFALHTSILKPQERRVLYTDRFQALLTQHQPTAGRALRVPPWDDSVDPLDWMMLHDQANYLPDCLMVKVDIASMANGLEVRCPFLDHAFLTFTSSLPSSWKRNGGGAKVLLKEAMAGRLPREVIEKPKTGFAIPLARWLRRDLADLARGLLFDDVSARRGLFEPAVLRRIWEDHQQRRRDWSNRLWALLMLELWFRTFLD